MSSSENQRQLAQFQIVTCFHERGKDTVNPRGGFSFDVANSRIMHHQQCSEIPFNPRLPHSSLHAFKCWDAWIPLTICYSSPSMKPVSLLRFPGWLTTLQSFELERNMRPDPFRHPPSRPRSCSQLSLMLQMGISSCAHWSVMQDTAVLGLNSVWQWVSVSSLLIFHQPALGLGVTVAQQRLGSWQEDEPVCSPSIFELDQLNNAETPNVLQKADMLTRHAVLRSGFQLSQSTVCMSFLLCMYLFIYLYVRMLISDPPSLRP